MEPIRFLPNPLKITSVPTYDEAAAIRTQWHHWKNVQQVKDWYQIIDPVSTTKIPTGPDGIAFRRQLPGPFYVTSPVQYDRLNRIKYLVETTIRKFGKWDKRNNPNFSSNVAAKLLKKNPRFRSPAYDALFSSDLDRKTRIYQEKLKNS